MLSVAVRDGEGLKYVFDVAPEDAANHVEAVALAREHFPDAALALLQALPLFGATKTLPAMGALKARAAPAFGKLAISALGSGTALAVAEDNSEAPNARKWQR